MGPIKNIMDGLHVTNQDTQEYFGKVLHACVCARMRAYMFKLKFQIHTYRSVCAGNPELSLFVGMLYIIRMTFLVLELVNCHVCTQGNMNLTQVSICLAMQDTTVCQVITNIIFTV